MALIKYVVVFFFASYAHSSPLQPLLREYRLEEGIIDVSHYDIELRLDHDVFESNVFSGIVEIKFTSLVSTSEIKLHANRLTISEVTLRDDSGTDIELPEQEYVSNEYTDILTISTDTALEEGSNYVLGFTYTGVLRTDEMYGFYKSYYIDQDGNRKYLGTTQFQPTHARKVFPCFDEPSYKAQFDIKIRHPEIYNAIGNTVGEELPDPDDIEFTFTTFVTTPKMSTYLIAFVVSDFTCSENEIKPGIPHIICSRDEAKADREAAKEVGPKLVKILEDYTNIDYNNSELTKMHQVAIPDFSAGAMENWGLLTYRETGLLYDKDETSNSYLQRLQNVVAHEIAHMWFGNLVTCKWWSFTFLNEGFARYWQYHATAQVDPTWELEKQFVIEQVQSIFVSDAQPTAWALTSEASTQSQVSGKFGSISYNKGATILRMIKFFMGANNFQTGVQKYLEANQFSSVEPSDLWDGLQTAVTDKTLPADVTLAEVMDNWINKAGFPILTVDLQGSDVVISQKRFLISGGPGDDEKWYIPITYTTSADSDKFQDTTTKLWLLPTDDKITISNVITGEDDWIVFNNQQIGYYRVDYDRNLWDRIEKALAKSDFGDIQDINRAQIVDDLYNFANVDRHTYSHILEFYKFLTHDTSYYSWYPALTAFSTMLQRISDDRVKGAFSNYLLELLETVYKEHDFYVPKNEDQIYTLNRVQVITWVCRLGGEDCINNALTEFEKYKETEQKPDRNLKGVIYCNGLRHSKEIEHDWEFLWGEYGNTKLATEQATIISALGCATDETVLRNYLSKSIDSTSGIRQQDALSVFSSVYTQNPGGVDIAFRFLLEKYNEIGNYYGSLNSLNSLFSGLAGRFTRQEQVDELRRFLENTEDLTESVITSAEAALTNAEANLKWIENFEEELKIYFDLAESSSEKPSSEDPSSEKPSTEDPSSEKPSTEDPSSEKPSTEDPSSEKPSTEDPSSEKPSTEEPGTGTADALKVGVLTLIITVFVSAYQLY